ncbi:hypothetical protein B8W92_10870 [Moraxella osloensis]|nr:Ig-like domain-containing protein [Moraxella osloensis]PAL13078.1 hypothetical protein B8W92_10870 [Moraxella osloensis]
MAISTNLIKSFQLSALTTALALAGCGGGGGNDTLPPPSKPGQSNGDTTTPTTNVKDIDSMTITKSFNTFILKQDEKFTIIANALKSGKPVEGVIVDAIIPDPATSGIYVITPTPITTNANGEAAIELQIKDLAKATAYLKANSDKLSISVKPTNSKQAITNGTISLTGAAPSISSEITNVINDARSLTLSPSNANFKLEVGTQITVSAFVADSKGGALKNVPVTFDLSNLPSLGIYNLSGSTVNTDDRGIATITLQVMSLDKREDLKNGFQVDALIDRDIDLKASNRPTFKGVDNLDTNTGSVTAESLVNSIILTPNVDSIPLTIGSTFTLTVTTNDKDNKPISNAPIAFTYPTLAEYGLTVANSSATTNGSGQATVTFTVNSLTTAQKAKLIEGFNVNASSNGKFAQASLTAKNETAESLVNSISLTPSVDTISLAPNAQFSITATTLGKDGKPVSNAPVAFSYPTLADYGLTIANSSTNTNGSGQAVMTFAVNASLTTAQKAKLAEGFTVNASSNAKTATAVTLKAIKVATVADIAKVSFFTNKDLTTNTGDIINVTAQVRDANNVGLANMPVSFTLLDAAAATGITNTTPLQATTNANGEAVLTLKVGALTPDQKYYLQTSGLSFKATAGAITSSTVTLRTQEAITANSVNSLLLTSDSAIQLAVGSKVKVTALAIDKNGAVVPNAQVSFKIPTDSGLVNNTGAVVNTNANGEATIEVEIKDLAKATTALQNGLVVTAQSGVSVGTTTVRSATSNANTPAYQFFVNKSKDSLTTGSDEMTLTIHVTDTKGGIKADVPVYLQILDNGVSYGLSFDKTSSLTTDSSGNVVVTLKQSDIGLLSKLNHDAKVKVIVNDGNYQAKEQTLDIAVSGTVIQNATASQTSVLPTDNVTLTGTLLDGTQKAIANTTIELFNENDPTTVIATAVTNAAGAYNVTKAVSQLGADVGSKINLAVRASNQASPASYQVFSNLYTLTKLTPNTTTITVSQNGGNTVGNEALVDQPYTITVNAPTVADNTKVYLSTTKGQLTVSGQTGTRIPAVVTGGKAVFSITSGTPGNAVLTVEDEQAKPLLSDNISFISRNVDKFFLNSDITIVNTNGEAKVTATVKDSLDRPIKNAIVEFSLVKDASGGRISNAYVLTDETGLATIRYYAGKVPTAVDAVQIKSDVKAVRVGNTDMLINSPKTATKTLTVQNQAASIGVSFSDKVASSDDQVYYIMNGSIYVVNSTGKPVVNQPVSVSVIPDYYRGGEFYAATDASGNAVAWGMRAYRDFSKTLGIIPTKIEDITCRAEDLNLNNILDGGEDTNTNGKLDPFNPVAILGGDGSVLTQDGTATLTTDATGKLDIKLRYAKDTANWFTANVRVTTKVDGTEYVQQRSKFEFPVLVTDITDFTIRPNWRSPFADGAVINPIDSGSGYNVCLTPYK